MEVMCSHQCWTIMNCQRLIHLDMQKGLNSIFYWSSAPVTYSVWLATPFHAVMWDSVATFGCYKHQIWKENFLIICETLMLLLKTLVKPGWYQLVSKVNEAGSKKEERGHKELCESFRVSFANKMSPWQCWTNIT